MLYRIVCNGHPLLSGHHSARQRLLGAFSAGVHGFDQLNTPQITNKRARFYFTEKGWKLFGRVVAANARKAGLVARVRRCKNPDSSQIIYEDEFQVALLVRKQSPRQ
jgi:hypothetical protein